MAETERQRAIAQARQRQALARASAQQSPEMRQGLTQLSAMTQNPQVLNAPEPRTPGFIERVADNVIGLDNGYRSAGEIAAAALNKGGESMTLGIVGDEAAGKFDEMIGRRENGVEFYRQQEDELRESNPGVALAAEIAPAFIPGAGGAKLAKAASSLVGRGATAAGLGAVAGGTYGYMEGDDGNRAAEGALGAGLGLLIGPMAQRVGDALPNLPRRLKGLFQRSEQRPTVETLRATKNAAYQAVEQSGESFDGPTMGALSQRLDDIMKSDPSYVPGEDAAVDTALRMFSNRSGQDTTISQLDRMRQGLWRRYRANPDQVQILDMISEVDGLIDERAATSELMAAARAANSRYSKSQLLEDAFTRATDQTASTGSGGNILNKYRQAVTSIINNPNKARFFSQQEIDVMRGFVRGDFGENVLRKIGKLSPNGNGLMLTLHAVGGMATSGATLPLMVAGAAAKQRADASVMRGADAIQDMLSGYRPAPTVPQIGAPGASSALASGVGGNYATDAVTNKQR